MVSEIRLFTGAADHDKALSYQAVLGQRGVDVTLVEI